MAESLCGPSNALQNFQKHSTVDRTLQQDRLVSRQSPSQGFRSSPGPNGAYLEPEFQAFQQGAPPLESQQGFQTPLSHAHPNFQQAGPAAWASDFQRMQISNPPPREQYRDQMSGGPVQRVDAGGWHQDFARQFGAEQRVMAQTSQISGGSAYGYSPMSAGMSMAMAMQSQFGGEMMGQQAEQQQLQQQQQQQQQQQAPEVFDEAAFARAFDDAVREEDIQAGREHLKGKERADTSMEMGQDVMLEESAERFMSSTEHPIPDQARLGADLIHDPLSENQERPRHEDPDALARTAGQLLDSVRSNQSSKFQNSEFLELMRQLRDREVMVKGDDIVGAAEGVQGDELKKDIISLLQSLRELVIERDSLILRSSNSGATVRNILTVLLKLSSAATNKVAVAVPYEEIRRTLQAVIDAHHSLSGLRAIRNQIRYTLYAFNSLENAKANIPPRLLSAPSISDSIRLANTEITSLLPPTDTALDTLIYNYISTSLQSPPEAQDPSLLFRLLGYTYTARNGEYPLLIGPQNHHTWLAKEIMGPAIQKSIAACRGFWGPLLSVDDFFAVVAAFGADQSPEPQFLETVKRVEDEIEEGLRDGLRRYDGGYPYRFGGSALGLEKKPFLTSEQLKDAAEARERLAALEAGRKDRNLRYHGPKITTARDTTKQNSGPSRTQMGKFQ